MDKMQLQTKRQALISQEQSATDHAERTAIQLQLAEVNAAIKSLGAAEHAANMQRRSQRQQRFKAAESKPTGLQTRGEFILMSAKRLLAEIENINPAHHLPHTTAILEPLRTFVAAQKVHVKEYRARMGEAAVMKAVVGEDEAWRETWTNGHHGRDDRACPACGTDSTTGCIV